MLELLIHALNRDLLVWVGQQDGVGLHAQVLRSIQSGQFPDARKALQLALEKASHEQDEKALAWLRYSNVGIDVAEGRWGTALENIIAVERGFESQNLPVLQIRVMLDHAVLLHFLGLKELFLQVLRQARALLDATQWLEQGPALRFDDLYQLILADHEFSQGHFAEALRLTLPMLMQERAQNAQDRYTMAFERHVQLITHSSSLHSEGLAAAKKIMESVRSRHEDQILVHQVVDTLQDLLAEKSPHWPRWEVCFANLQNCGEAAYALRETKLMLMQLAGKSAQGHQQMMVRYTDAVLEMEKQLPKPLRSDFLAHYEFNPHSAESISVHYQLSRLVDITKGLLTEHNLENLLHCILVYLSDYAQMDRGFILLTKGTQQHVAKTFEYPQQSLGSVSDLTSSPALQLAKSILLQGQTLVIDDIDDESAKNQPVEFVTGLRADSVRSVMVLPLKYQENVLGVVYMDSKTRSHVEVNYLDNFGITIGIAVHNAITATSTQRVLQHARKIIEDQKIDLSHRYMFENFIGISSAAHELIRQIRKVADSSATIVITGESGSGKEMVARITHHNSPRRQQPFVAINCAAIPENLLESEFFGHQPGAFTGATEYRKGLFEQADGGTIFLDEIGELPLAMQTKLLRVLQEREVLPLGASRPVRVDTRVLCATHQKLEDMVQAGKFREDLYYRIQVVSLVVPPLRDRTEDIPLFIEHALRTYARENNVAAKSLSAEALNYLIHYSWPGNVRELINVIYNLCVFVDHAMIGLEDLTGRHALFRQDESPQQRIENVASHLADQSLSLSDAKKEFEKIQIQHALNFCNGQIAAASRRLGMPRPQLSRLVKKYGLKDHL